MMRESIAAQSGTSAGDDYEVEVAHSLGSMPEFVFLSAKSNAIFWLHQKSTAAVKIRSDTSKTNFEVLCIVDHSIIK